jgi:uncharacterized SAM-binding protein YcdF (DUF218 family)
MILGVAKELLVPGSISLFVLAALVVAILVRRGARKTAAVLGAALITGYLLFSLPAVAVRLEAVAERGERPVAQSAPRAEAVAVLDGDSANARVDEAMRLVKAAPPRWLIVSGNDEWSNAVRQRAVDAGFPRDHIIIEPRGRTTREQARRIATIVRHQHIASFLLVVSTIHMPRTLAVFRTFGLCPLPAASQPDYAAANVGWRALAPRLDALDLSRDATYEFFAWKYYQWRGWLADVDRSDPMCRDIAD